MKTTINSRKKKFLAFFLSVLMVSSTAVFFASCTEEPVSDSSESSESSSEIEEVTEADDGLVITNGNFNTFNTNKGLNVIGTTVTGWTLSVNSSSAGGATSSNAASGIIDTSEEAWKNLTQKTAGLDYNALAANAANITEEKWDSFTVKDKLAFYDAWNAIEANKNLKIEEEFEYYEKFNVSEKDLFDIANPGTHTDAKDSKILMIHNDAKSTSSKIIGTAQKFTSSSSVVVPAGTAARFSVWVKTHNLKSATSAGVEQDAIQKGAYISITHSVGGSSLDAYQVKNINTDGVTDNNGWVEYEFFLRSSAYTDSTFTIVLGLGQGGKENTLEYVNGYAFFDDISYEAVDSADFDAQIAAANIAAADVATFDWTKEQKTVNAYKVDRTAFALDFLTEAPVANNDVLNNVTVEKTKMEDGSAYDYDLDATNDVTKVFPNFAAMEAQGNNNTYLASVYNNYFADTTFAKDSDVLMLLSSNGTAYTATSSAEIGFNGHEYLALSFFVKTSDMNGNVGASVTLNDGLNKTQFTSIDTSSYTPVDIDENNKDIYDGWQKYFFFVSNDTEKADATFTLDFGFGPLTIDNSTSKDSFYEGFAAFTNFEVHYIDTKAEFECAQAGTYAKVVSLTGETEEEETTGNSGFDSAATVPSNKIETGYANPKNYKGVYSNSAYIDNGNTNLLVNQNENAGLLNKEHAANYTEILTALGGAGATWESVFGNDVSQPLVIAKSTNASNADKDLDYGFIGASTAIAANAYKAVSLRIKTNATANIYLIDTDDTSFKNTLSIGRNASYWYDDEGNVCIMDPSSPDYNKRTDIAFKIQSNGLYKVNPNWSGASKANANAYYANLSVYTEKDSAGNLLVAEGGASHNYSSAWDNEGMDGIAFYNKAGTYYADKACTIPVADFSASAIGVPTRYDAAASKELKHTVTDTNGEWVTVTFYIHAGATAKNYRLEVWSGDRAKTAVNTEATDYVFVDTNNPGSADSNFASLITEYKELVDEKTAMFEDVFSYYDTAKFLRYNAALDENGYGNLYANGYTPSSYYESQGVAYLEYVEDNNYTVFADYSLADVAVTAESIPTDDEEEVEEEEEDTVNLWLLASSIAVAAVLVLAVVSIIIRKSVEASRRKRGVRTSIDSANKPSKVKKAKVEKVKKSEEKDDGNPYND